MFRSSLIGEVEATLRCDLHLVTERLGRADDDGFAHARPIHFSRVKERRTVGVCSTDDLASSMEAARVCFSFLSCDGGLRSEGRGRLRPEAVSQPHEKFLLEPGREFRFDKAWRIDKRSCGCRGNIAID
jgi:hypothetical protein